MWETILAGHVWNGEMCNKRKDGSLYWLETSIFPILDSQGKPHQFVAVRKDVSDINRQLSIYNAIIDTVSHCIFTMNLRGQITLFNKGAQHLLGYSADEILGLANPLLFLDPDEVDLRAQALSYELQKPVPKTFEVLIAKTATTGQPDQYDWTFISKTGQRLTIQLSVTPLIRTSDLQKIGYVAIGLDVSVHRKIASQVPGVIFQYSLRPDGSSFFPYVSEGVASVLRLRPQDLRTHADAFFNLVSPEDLSNLAQALRESARELRPLRLEFRIHFGPEIRWILTNAIPETTTDGTILWHGFMTDITTQKNVEEQVRWSAFHDPLTGLHNRLYAQNEILRMEYSRYYPIAVFNIDLDGLKAINDRHGHEAGDEYIQSAAEVMRRVFRTEDLVARMGGDEFLALVPQTNESGVSSILERLQEQLQIVNQETSHTLSFSVGTQVAHVIGDLERAIREADRLMYQDKFRRKAQRQNITDA